MTFLTSADLHLSKILYNLVSSTYFTAPILQFQISFTLLTLDILDFLPPLEKTCNVAVKSISENVFTIVTQ